MGKRRNCFRLNLLQREAVRIEACTETALSLPRFVRSDAHFLMRLRREWGLNGVVDVGTSDVKAVFKRIPFSRKFVLIGGAILLVGGASGIAAVFVGKETLLGPSYASMNGLECKTVQTVNIKKNGSFEAQKYLPTSKSYGGFLL